MKKKRLKMLIMKIIGSFLLFFSGIITIISIHRIEFFNTGEDYTIINLNDNYSITPEMKVCNILGCKKVADAMLVNKIDTSIPGIYTQKYVGYYKNKSYYYEKQIEVIDNVKPVISLNGENVIYGKPNSYEEEGFIAIDNLDGDITSKVEISQEGNVRKYSIKDSSGNIGYAERIFEYTDKIKPEIRLNGKAIVYVNSKDKFNDPGVIIKDDSTSEKDLKLTIDGEINYDQVGSYILTYNVVDLAGNSNSVTREIRVYNFDTNNAQDYWQSLEYYIKEKGYRVSLGYYNFDQDLTYTYDANKIYYGASLIKTLGALYAFENLKLDQALESWVTVAIKESDNQAYFNIVRRIGENNLRNYGKSLGATKVLVGVDLFGSTLVGDQLIYMKYLYNYINSHENGEKLKSYFINDHYNVVKFSGCPTVLHKYGYYGIYFHEDAIFLDESPYVLIILSEEAENNYQDIFKDISEKVYNLNKLVKRV